MKNLFARLILIGTVFTAGCEGAMVPLGDADQVQVDQQLIGEWMALDDEQEASVITIWAYNDTEYYLEWIEEGSDPETVQIRAFTTELEGLRFSNVQCIVCDDDEREWFFYRFELVEGNELHVQGIKNKHYRDAMGDMTRSKDVRRYVRRHLDDMDFFEEEIGIFTRVLAEED